MRTRKIALLGVMTAGVLLSQQACGNATAAEPAAAPAASKAAVPSPSEAADTTTSPAAEKTGGEVPDCETGALAATITLQPDGDGDTRMGLVTLTNESGTECGIDGWATVSLTNPANEVVDVPAENVDQPGASVAAVLKSGNSAYQGIKWTICEKGDAGCGAGNGLSVSLGGGTGKPAELEGFPAPEKNGITMASLKIGTIQPSRQGVVAW
ncbi:DUF4232 domain-containing protein [Actinoplanes sp. NBRC 101535]|uniref:DUF4232 domain-containing protein n=1 Tax=Actinoplanes sp. NBRC 101535 TaxID=3032196 RepID=UPI0024A33485|nr:DUF4232 domain-containing protein [Actinoplanes sp. NBRC 101535]GLY02347.1 hypothetical protein Acsp01_27260 [Actinoplanes sp. NBRC 101535]